MALAGKTSMKKLLLPALLTLALFFSAAFGVMADTDTGVLTVSANVIGGAKIESVANITHTDYDPTDPTTPNDATGSVTVRATKGVPYKIYIGSDRVMTNGSDTLNYELYSDSGRTAAWGDSFATGQGYTSTSNAASAKNIYSRIPVLQNVPAGAYADAVTVTLEW